MTLVLVYDGGCPFCRHFALRSELVGGVPDLAIRDGRSDHRLRAQLKARGLHVTRLARGVPIGSELEYVDLGTIAHALHDRR